MTIFNRLLFTLLCLTSFSSPSIAAQGPEGVVSQQFNKLLEAAKTEGHLAIPRLNALPDAIKSQQSKSNVTPFIIGGNNATRGEYPEYALVLITDSDLNIVSFCGGTLIARNKVLTAAHCAQAPANQYFVLPNFYNFNDPTTANSFFRGRAIASHPAYNPSRTDYDIAILTLSRNAFTARAKVHSGANQFAGKLGKVIGTGAIASDPNSFSDILQEVDAPITSNEACNDAWESATGVRLITPRMMCAGFTFNGRGSCFGDSGGPLFATVKGERTIVGTVSFGLSARCEDNRATQGYARVSTMESFIRSQSPQTQFVVLDETVPLAPITLLLSEEEEK